MLAFPQGTTNQDQSLSKVFTNIAVPSKPVVIPGFVHNATATAKSRSIGVRICQPKAVAAYHPPKKHGIFGNPGPE